MKIGLISCCKVKQNKRCKAKDMYVSPWFKKGMEYLSYRCDKIYIMSARYGLLPTESIITPYNQTLLKMNKKERKLWSKNLLEDIKRECDIKNDTFIIVARGKYTEYICQKLVHFENVFDNIPISSSHGNISQMHWLNVWNNEFKKNKL